MLKIGQKVARNLASLEIWLVATFVIVSMVYPRLLAVTVISIAIFWPIRWVAFKRMTIRTPADLGIGVFLLMMPVTLWVTVLPEITHPQVLRLLIGVLLYYSIVNWATKKTRLQIIILGTLGGGLLLTLGAPFSVDWARNKLFFIPDTLYNRFTILVSDSIHPNVLAGTVLLIFPLAVALILFSWKELKLGVRILVSVTTLVISSILLITQSRGALIALPVVLIILVSLRWRWGWLSIPIVILCLVIIIQIVDIQRILDFIVSSNTLGGIEGRLEVWSRALYMAEDFSITGIGMGSFERVVDILYPFYRHSPGNVEHAHNLIIQIAVDIGIVGLVAWSSIFIVVSFISWQVFRRGRLLTNNSVSALGAGLFCSQVALLIHGLTDAVTWGMVKPAPIVWALWGLAIASWNVNEV